MASDGATTSRNATASDGATTVLRLAGEAVRKRKRGRPRKVQNAVDTEDLNLKESKKWTKRAKRCNANVKQGKCDEEGSGRVRSGDKQLEFAVLTSGTLGSEELEAADEDDHMDNNGHSCARKSDASDVDYEPDKGTKCVAKRKYTMTKRKAKTRSLEVAARKSRKHHLQEKTDDGLEYHCDKCDQTVIGTWRYNNHLNHNGVRCRITGDLDIPVITLAEPPTCCSMCQQQFKTINQLGIHCRKQHPDAVDAALGHFSHHAHNPCPVCQKKYPRHAIPNHVWRMHGLRVKSRQKFKYYKCDDCDFRTSSESILIDHLNKHQGIKGSICDECGKMFANSQTLRSHMKMHSGVRELKCQFCERTFYRHSNLKNHEALHIGHKPYKCNLCHKSFTQTTSIHFHFKKYHPEIPKEKWRENRTYTSLKDVDLSTVTTQELSQRSKTDRGSGTAGGKSQRDALAARTHRVDGLPSLPAAAQPVFPPNTSCPVVPPTTMAPPAEPPTTQCLAVTNYSYLYVNHNAITWDSVPPPGHQLT